MMDLRNIIIQGIREAVPRGQNISKALNERQGKDESPIDWLERIRKSIQMYSGLDPDTAVGEALIKTQFVAKSWEDIRRKLEKLDGWQERGLQELLREAQRVYVRRDEEKAKAKAKVFVAAVKEVQNGGASSGKAKTTRKIAGEGSKRPTCFYCGMEGHVKRVCKKREADQKLFVED